jgi:hypothetical protein
MQDTTVIYAILSGLIVFNILKGVSTFERLNKVETLCKEVLRVSKHDESRITSITQVITRLDSTIDNLKENRVKRAKELREQAEQLEK